MKRILIIILALLLPSAGNLITAQVAYAPEKVYVHLDRNYFAVGETIWLKGYVESIVPVPDTSRFLYVELLDKEGVAKLRGMIRFSEENGFAGHLDLPEQMDGGRYTLRAYTRWQMNWPEERMFHTPVDIYDGTDETVAPDGGGPVDISFYPEGGRYYSGVYASVGFKAMASDGRGVDWTGVLYDDLGRQICECRTEHAGMGLIGFTPEEGRRYRLVSADGGSAWDLPQPTADGATLQVRRTGDYFAVQVINHTGAPVLLQLRKGGERVTLSSIESSGRTLRVPVSASGLQKFLLTDENGSILSERPVFLEDPVATVSVSVNYDNPDYIPRRRWNVNLELPSGADSAELSVSVVRGAFRHYQQEGNLTSYMLLGSEIRGFVENPDYYFDRKEPSATRMNHLDLLLMIQGWTYYDDDEIVSSVDFPKEQMQSLQGEIRSVFGNPPRRFNLTLMAPGLNSTQIVRVDKGSRFLADSLDFPDSTVFIVVADKGGTRKPYYPVLLEDFAPKAAALSLAEADRSLAGKTASLPKLTTTDGEDTFQPSDAQHDTIQATVIQAIAPRIRTPFGSSELSNIKSKEVLANYGHYSISSYVVMTNTNLQRSGNTVINLKTGYLSEGTEKFETVSLYVNGFPTDWDMADAILMDEVEKISISTYMTDDAFLARSYGGIVMVELKEAGRSASLKQQTNTIVAMPLGWQRPKEFYNPVYDKHRTLAIPDRRNTVYWNPSVKVGTGAPAEINLMTEDRSDAPYFIRIEGRTADGRWISTTRTLD